MKILDTTIRDGSYAVDFKFSCDDVVEITTKLEKLGIEYVEIGHGMGLNASSLEHGLALHSDLEYMNAVKDKFKNVKIGFFCIPGIARLEDLKLAKDNGVDFVRVGINADKPEKTEPYIREAKSLGMTVMTNFMKSYVVTPEQFAINAKQVEEYGTDYVYIVDSAGCMLASEIGEYYDAVRKVSNVKLGFHGHDNLGLAVANSIYCVEKGFDLIDCSLQGLGRSIGNASTEMVVMTLDKMNYPINIDIPCLLEYGYVLLRDITNRKLQNPLDLVCGYAGFHSGYLKDIYKCCNEKKVDPLRLIIAYSKIDKKNMDYKLLCKVAEDLPKDYDVHPYKFRDYFSAIYSDK
ncbi:MAG: 4-hydroxy-2-oxovalerate aldolase [Lachnospiraceae bacterium]|nr:4-hydroxy-2-oxovalerate aldolase [Lachnospiraceae bacterium]